MEAPQVKDLVRDWNAYVVAWTHRITEKYEKSDYEGFWRMAKFFIRTFPPEVKQEIESDIRKVDKTLNLVSRIKPKLGMDRYIVRKMLRERRNKVITTLGVRVWFKFHDILANRGYKERKGGIFEE